MNIADLFIRAARQPWRPAVALGPDVLMTYGELVRRAAVIAGRLREIHGLGPAIARRW